ncbi:major facilitator superfamily [Sphaerulina musiva SO2202]|uniref:Cercosporin MFS transporter CTB4 n=1 Tax=Sphaerulina musiva (strain SO2202) TaxID=692275 RepID=N1QLQ3_SPHMS|nr:major facilitator superfamily [Sphaerulina musiva SO2202]EMF16678.1 major facilitator superfamily [Sphaerulina musiva SO2202]
MNAEDRWLSDVERDASPERFHAQSASTPGAGETRDPAATLERHEPMERTVTAMSSSTSSSLSSGIPNERRETTMSRTATQADLERHPTALSRIQTGRSQHSGTVGASLRSRTATRHSRTALPAFGAGKPYPPNLPDREEYVVEFDGPDDPLHAHNWPLRKKLPVTIVLGYVTLTAAFGSSIFSTATGAIATQFDLSREVGILGVSLYVLGFATGPILWAPFSELYGRKAPLLISSFGFSIFNLAVAVGKDAQTVFICRFFSGFFGACPLTIVGAVFADMFSNRQRGLAITVFSIAVFAGPLLAPFIGGFIVDSYLGWRWTEWITSFMGFLGLGLLLIFLEETYAPALLVSKAADLRRRTKNWGIHAKQEEIEIDLRELIEKNLSRPMRMLFTEPIVFLLSIYMAFIYGLLYLFLTFYPIVFQQIYGFSPGVGGLPFFGMILGEIFAGIFMIILQPAYNRKLAANNDVPIPEWRLPPVIVGGVSFAIGLLWFGWTGFRSDIHWIAPTLSGIATGFGLLTIFLQCLNYLIDAYLVFAASAIAANTFLRSLAGAGFPLFATQMINGMGVQWAGTLLGCLAFACVPMPVWFYLRGSKIREKSRFATTFPVASAAAQDASSLSEEKVE